MNTKNSIKSKRKGGPDQKAVQPHVPERGVSGFVPNLGFNYGSSSQQTTELAPYARLYRPLPRGM